MGWEEEEACLELLLEVCLGSVKPCWNLMFESLDTSEIFTQNADLAIASLDATKDVLTLEDIRAAARLIAGRDTVLGDRLFNKLFPSRNNNMGKDSQTSII